MADNVKKKRKTELENLNENITKNHRRPNSHFRQRSSDGNNSNSNSEMSQRNRRANRNNGNGHGEEVVLWEQIKTNLREFVDNFNQENNGLRELIDKDREAASNLDNVTHSFLAQMEKLTREGVKFTDRNQTQIKNIVESMKILRAIVHKEEATAPVPTAVPNKRTGTRESTASRDNAASASAPANSSLYDFPEASDSPVPSPIGASSSRSSKLGDQRDRDRDRDRDRTHDRDRDRDRGDRDRDREKDRSSNRDSMPPKADSVEPQGPSGSVSGGSSLAGGNKSKVFFSKGDAVAFKPKVASGEQTSDWILGEVAQVLGEGKSRRYKVLDIEPDDHSKQKEYRSSASSMIPITPESQASTLKPWEAGKMVLALYPNTTTFYKAEVHSMGDDGRVNLKFEGENDSTTLQQVERRFVIEYRA